MSPSRLSLPKNKIRILLLEGISESAIRRFAEAGYENVRREEKALDGAALRKAVKGVHMLGIRSRTQITPEILDAADRLIAIGCFCIGTNQVALEDAAMRGIPVFNAPFSNTRSVAELTLAEIIMLLRGIFPKSNAAHAGVWDKSAANAREVRGKTLGIVGYGNIGSQLSVLAEALGMRVVFFDRSAKLPHGNAEPMPSLQALLAAADIVTLHVPETPETVNMIGAAEIRAMKKGAVLINNARGSVVDLEALAAALRDGHLLGAAVDVFPVEPSGRDEAFVTPLQGLPNVILTPHIGGSTEEAQWRIGEEVASKLIAYSDTGATVGAVNFPQVELPARPTGARYLHVHRNVPGVLRQVDEAFARRHLNISAQFLQTRGEIGYVVIDSDNARDAARELLEDLRAIAGTIRARLVYEWR
jgi:D-3-phosphoglycerate dehydrogenase